MKTVLICLASLAVLTGCGAPSPTPSQTRAATSTASAIVDPAALYCQGTGGTVIPRTAGGRRADLCRLADGRTVSAGDWLNSHNDL